MEYNVWRIYFEGMQIISKACLYNKWKNGSHIVLCLSYYFFVYFSKLELILFYYRVYYYPRIFLNLLLHPVYLEFVQKAQNHLIYNNLLRTMMLKYSLLDYKRLLQYLFYILKQSKKSSYEISISYLVAFL